MTRFLPIVLVAILGFSQNVYSQNYNLNGSSITDCSGSFFDSGGGAGNYGNNQNLTATLCSDGTIGTHVRLDFSGVDLQAGDELCFYDGVNLAAPLLSCASDYNPGDPFAVQATAVNPSGCITVSFVSDAAQNSTGWSSVISCVASCQQILAQLTAINPAPVPADTGWIDVCPGERIFFTGKGVYPQNNFAYAQSDLTTAFEWSFGDGDIAYGPNVSHKYDSDGGYYVQLNLTDVQGCKSTNLINQRVRVAPRPVFNIGGQIPQTICAKDTIELGASVDGSAGASLSVNPGSGSFEVGGTRSDSLALPDGTGIPYKTSIYFTQFSPGQLLTDINDLLSVCVNMEHSWMRDIEISLACPNGTEVTLHNFGGQTGSQVFLGIPNDNDGFNPVPGSGFDYCWAPNASNPTWLQYANSNLPGGGGTLPAGTYSSFESLNNFIGCPLNGEWTMTVTDLWPIDNGFIFSWSINLNQSLYPDIEVFEPGFVSWNWNNHPSIFYQTADSIAAAPQNAGTAGYVFTVNDDFGCTWDTLVTVEVLPFTHPNCYNCVDNFKLLKDTTICLGEMVALDASTNGQTNPEVRFEAFPDYKIGAGNHPHANPYSAPISISSTGFNTITNPLTQIASVCMEIETDYDSDLNIYLRAPSGQQLELSTGNGGSGDNYKTTCFSPSAVTPVIGSAAPFNGTYKPEGNWASLNGASVNGDWKLVVSDGFGINNYGKLKWWSIGFNTTPNTQFTWTNPASLSCGNCPNPVATPTTTTDYIVSTTDNYGCIHRDTGRVTVLQTLPAPANLTNLNPAGGQITFVWDAVAGAIGYEVNVNGSGWQTPTGTLNHTVSGLAFGDHVTIEVRALGANSSCGADASMHEVDYLPCNLDAFLTGVLPAECPGQANGSAYIAANFGVSPIEYFLDGVGAPYNSGGITNAISAGSHFVIVVDGAGCRDTVYFTITEPPALLANATGTDAICNNDNSGSVCANGSGGNPGAYTYQWQSCTGGTVYSGSCVNNLFAGCYVVTISDAQQCKSLDTITISQPPGFSFSSTQDSVSCYNGTDGSATIFPTGGMLPYTYLWDNGQPTQTATGLDANFHSVTVTDNVGCQAVTLVQVKEPTRFKVDSLITHGVPCFGGFGGSATVYGSGGTLPFSYLWNNSEATQTITDISSGFYTVTITDGNGCTDDESGLVTAPQALLLQLQSFTGETCANACNGSATVKAFGGVSPYTYIWSDPSIPTNVSTYNALCPGAYIVTVEDANGCTQTVNINISAAIALSANTVPTDPKCSNTSDGSIVTTSSGGAQPHAYAWSTGATTKNLTNLPCGTFTLTITDNLGCTLVKTVTLNCPPDIAIDSIVATDAKCFGDANGQIAVYPSGGSGGYSYLWSDGNNQINPIAVNLTVGNYTVSVEDSNGCPITAQGTVGQPTALGGSISGQDVLCFGGNTGSAQVMPTGGTSPYSVNWSSAGLNGATVINLTAGTYSATITDANLCTFNVGSVVIAAPASDISIAVNQTVTSCFGLNKSEAVALGSGGNGAPFLYQWSNGQSGNPATNLPTGSVTVTVSDAEGCAKSTTLPINELDEILLNIIGTVPSCQNSADGQVGINLISGGIGAGNLANYSYHWNIAGAPNAAVLTSLAGNTTYAVTATDGQGCTGSDMFNLGAPQGISFESSLSHVLCNGDSTGTITISNVNGPHPIASYSWSNGDATSSISNLPAGPYSLTIVDDLGCTETADLGITEPVKLEISSLLIDPLDCLGDTLGAITAIAGGGVPGYSYLWSTGSDQPAILNLKAGEYLVTVTDANGCTIEKTAVLDEPSGIAVDVVTEDASCFGAKNGRIKLNCTGGTAPYSYSRDGLTYNGSSTFLALGAGDYSFFIKDSKGCITSLDQSLTQPDPIEVDLGLDTTIQLGDSIILYPEYTNTFGELEFNWGSSYIDQFTCMDTLNCASVSVKPQYSNIYTVLITDENGCRGEAKLSVKVEKLRGVYVPTGFSPNGDINNDLLTVYGKSEFVKQVNYFKIFDRWGELIYEDVNFKVNDINRGWNGTHKDKDCNSGEYVWYLEVEYIDGYVELLKGVTTLIR